MSASTTYSELTALARERLTLALARPELTGARVAPDEVRRVGEVHRDLSSALAHLGRTLMRPVTTAPSSQRPASRRRGPQARLLRDLDRRGRGRDWVDPPPSDGTAARDVWEAARTIRAAADLWATHRSASGAPRSPESSRMRHPALLGAATREWHALVTSAGDVAEAVLRAGGHDQPASDGRGTTATDHLAEYPRPTARPDRSGSAIDITVARPTPRRSGNAVDLLAESVTRLRLGAWNLAESGQAPVPALANLAAIGAALSAAALEAGGPAGSRRIQPSRWSDPVAGSRTLEGMHAGWVDACRILADLRSPHPATTLLQVERLDLASQLRRVAQAQRPGAGQPDAQVAPHADTAHHLAALARRYAEVALFNARGLRAAAERGDLYVGGRALPQTLIARRPDLLQAKLDGTVVPAPNSVVAELEGAYRRIARAAQTVPTAGTVPPDVITRLARDDDADGVDAHGVDARDVDARDGSPAA